MTISSFVVLIVFWGVVWLTVNAALTGMDASEKARMNVFLIALIVLLAISALFILHSTT